LVWSDLLSTCAADSCRESRQGPLVEADTLAYLLYTSGSTGVPKGVMITHGNARAFVEWASATFDLTPDDHVAVHASLHFDLPVFDVYVGLAKGATLYLIDENTALFPEAFYLFLRDQAITVLYAVPSALIILTLRSSIRHQELQNLRYLLYAGEEYPPNHLRTLLDRLPNARIFNLYGPVETNVITQFEVKLEHLDLPHIPIGYPLFNTSLLLLDDNQQIVEEGEGEIVVSGPGVTPGYLNQPEQTQKAFCTVQVAEQTRTCYRTGDFAYRDHSGLLHFRGRRDSLIKTRGFRVELGDVEAALLRLPGVAEAAVVALPHPVYTNLMYAFVALQEALQVSESVILQGIREQLPSYMCPYQVFFRTQLPRTSTGTIARRPLQDELKALGK
ncbi:MAG TPA: AMP-binding protein, partial [Ktedonobacteraceae bacterium]|nr:AMP-binding protein [Ktedonobacteraceae bacterium]